MLVRKCARTIKLDIVYKFKWKVYKNIDVVQRKVSDVDYIFIYKIITNIVTNFAHVSIYILIVLFKSFV